MAETLQETAKHLRMNDLLVHFQESGRTFGYLCNCTFSPDLLMKTSNFSKTINTIYFYKNLAQSLCIQNCFACAMALKS